MRFADYGKRVVFAAFDGGEITSDAGVLLLREQARRIHLHSNQPDHSQMQCLKTPREKSGCIFPHRPRT